MAIDWALPLSGAFLMKNNPRATAAKILASLFVRGKSLSELTETLQDNEQAPLIQAFCYGVTRYYHQLDFIAKQLLAKPLKAKDQDIYCLLLTGLFQMIHMRVPDHAAVSETVAAVKGLKKPWAKHLVNGVLRTFQREQSRLMAKIDDNESAKFAYPSWIITRIKAAYPDTWQTILDAGNEAPPMTLRINQRMMSVDAYLDALHTAGIKAHALPVAKSAVLLEQPVPVSSLPKFKEGACFVQDASAQLAATFLDLQPGLRVLDACAAPGGKTTHLLETEPDLALLAVDSVPQRVEKIHENLNRLQLKAQVKCADILDLDAWWGGEPWDRILLDAPCSATGVIRRHPDIKHLRREEDIAALAELQQAMLQKLWPLLRPGGLFLYATCSIFPEENVLSMERFLTTEATAQEIKISIPQSYPVAHGAQILPGSERGDGFYYCLLIKEK
jgi:16S rRNA (cytosine967-C5)-methyltransferase